MGRPECSDSLRLEGSMNNQCRFMTVEDRLNLSAAIDTKDDKRRKISFNLDKWHEDMQKGFSRARKELLELEDLNEMREGLIEYDRRVDKFNVQYSAKRKKVQDMELYYEELDDDLRIWLLNYVVMCLELIKDESFNIDLRMIKENLEKKMEKKLKN